MAKRTVSADFEVVIPDDRVGFINSVIAEEGIKQVGFEGEAVSFAKYSRLKAEHPDIELCDIGEVT